MTVKNGAANRTRTCDPVITNDVLYQLSYCGEPWWRFGCGAGNAGASDIVQGPAWQEAAPCGGPQKPSGAFRNGLKTLAPDIGQDAILQEKRTLARGLKSFFWTRFLHANRCPLRSKTLRIDDFEGPFFLQNRGAPDIRCGRFRYFSETAPWFAAIAQLVEHVIRNDGVTGSSPVCGTSL